MKVLEKGIMPDGTHIQIEDWSSDYNIHSYGCDLATFPKSKSTHSGPFEPKANETYRFEFKFDSNTDAMIAFNSLITGDKQLFYFIEYFSSKREYLDCI
ncbi:hypothetical protein [Clostridium tertium]|uniref:hypothetical protein n=1 Tax=Clostridium tertium TaxID=1559 RepID=UPI0023B27208|nr:hypothetical protein [Clostridium tertium]